MQKIVPVVKNLFRLALQVKSFPLLFLPLMFLSSCNNPAKQTEPVTVQVENIKPTAEQAERRKQSEAYCKQHHIPIYTNPNSLFVDPDEKVTLQTKDEVVNRTYALCYIGLKSEGLEKDKLNQFDKHYNIASYFTTEEKAYASATQPTKQQTVDANWKYEDMHVMLWALGFIDSLNYPDQLCDVAGDCKIIIDLKGDFREKAKLRSKKEILDQADLILRLDWACVNARTKNEPAPGKLDDEVVLERHRALNWLINYMNQQWDDVTTDT